MMSLKTNYCSVTRASIKVMLMHHDGGNLYYENDQYDHSDEDDDQIRTDQQKAGTLIWPHQEAALHHPEFTPYAPLADKANFVPAE